MVAPPVAPREAPDVPLVDTHAHLNDRRFARDVDAAVRRAQAAGVVGMVVVGYDLPSSRTAVRLANQYDAVRAAVGIHPHHAKEASPAAMAEIERLAGDDRVVAIGECGLDFYRDLSPRPAQLAAFEVHLDLASRLGLPVVVHCRDAMAETLGTLEGNCPSGGGVMHCFDGTADDVQRVVALPFYVSAAGPLTFRRDGPLAAAIAAVPPDRLVIETDCPWLSPLGHRGERNEPAYVRLVAEAAAAVCGAELPELARRTSQNAARLFRTPALAGAALAALGSVA